MFDARVDTDDAPSFVSVDRCTLPDVPHCNRDAERTVRSYEQWTQHVVIGVGCLLLVGELKAVSEEPSQICGNVRSQGVFRKLLRHSKFGVCNELVKPVSCQVPSVPLSEHCSYYLVIYTRCRLASRAT
ncbi:hypothetical protein MB901379_00396 [Mycobacterium basiliense]|uniref:Uncharacterized protein n=1 Tax=Mycobacterium basiliense TaxID=2094119 RepID=A0A447G8R7_9MYCO|nr:hypothetical protein MB901379_00396 [Mycobacterium basiliense]